MTTVSAQVCSVGRIAFGISGSPWPLPGVLKAVYLVLQKRPLWFVVRLPPVFAPFQMHSLPWNPGPKVGSKCWHAMVQLNDGTKCCYQDAAPNCGTKPPQDNVKSMSSWVAIDVQATGRRSQVPFWTLSMLACAPSRNHMKQMLLLDHSGNCYISIIYIYIYDCVSHMCSPCLFPWGINWGLETILSIMWLCWVVI